MMRTMRRVGPFAGLPFAGLAALALAAAPLPASAQNTNSGAPPFRQGGRGDFRGLLGGPTAFLGPLRAAAAQLDLSQTQREQIRSLLQSHAGEWQALADRERQARAALAAAIAEVPFDEVTIRQRAAELASVQADAAVAAGRTWAEVAGILTPDQLDRLRQTAGRAGRRFGRSGS